MYNSQSSKVSSSARETERSNFVQENPKTIRKEKYLNSTDMILMQKETEKPGREAFSQIRKGAASKHDAHDIIMEWCFASVQVMMQAMTLSQNKSFTKRI